MLGNSFIWLKHLNSHWNLDCRLLVLSEFTGRLDTTLTALIMLLIFFQAQGLELFWFFPGATLTLMLPATLSGFSGWSLSYSFVHVYFHLYSVVMCNVNISFKHFRVKYKAWFTLGHWMNPCLNFFGLKLQTWNQHVLECWLTCDKEIWSPVPMIYLS